MELCIMSGVAGSCLDGDLKLVGAENGLVVEERLGGLIKFIDVTTTPATSKHRRQHQQHHH